MKTKKYLFKNRVVVFREPYGWVAQGLDYDYAAQGSRPSTALKHFETAMMHQAILDIACGYRPFCNSKSAPELYWKIFNGDFAHYSRHIIKFVLTQKGEGNNVSFTTKFNNEKLKLGDHADAKRM